MSDNVQENDMEGILSSIKNILEEDEKTQQVDNALQISDTANVSDNVLSTSPVDEVLELSPDMRVDDFYDVISDNDSVVIEATEIPVAEEPVFEVPAIENVAPVFEKAPVIEEKLAVSEPFFETELSEEVVPANETFFEADVDNTSIDDLLNDNPVVNAIPDVFEEDIAFGDEPSLDDLLGEDVAPVVEDFAPVAEETPFVEDFIPVTEETPVVEDFTPVAEETPLVEDFAPVAEETPLVEDIVPVTEETPLVEDIVPVTEEEPVVEEVAVFDPVIEIEPVVEDVVEEEQDVTSNLMSSFAKMFSHEENTEYAQITSAGNTSKTLEDLVVDAIQKAIGNEISAKWNNGADFNSFVEAEIRRQVETWIANNMNNVIEDIVKKEVERVIAKVGS